MTQTLANPPSQLPLVSVIIAAYQQPAFLNEALASVTAQSYDAIEIIVSDDASGAEYTSQYKLPNTARLIVQLDRHGTAAITRNAGIRQARGQYVAFLDQDDIWLPDKLKWQVQIMQQHPDAVLTFGHYRRVDAALADLPRKDRSVTIRPDALRQMIWRNLIHCPSQVIMRRDALEKIGLFDETIRGAADWDLWIRAAAAGRIISDPRVMMLYRQHPAQWSHRSLMMVKGAERVMEKTSGWVLRQRPDLARVMRRRWARWLREVARVQLEGTEEPAQALAMLRRAIRMWPLDVRSYRMILRAKRAARGTI